jgi:hypothetical protein
MGRQMAEEQDDPYESTTRWLQEAARRTRADSAAASRPQSSSESPLPAKRFGQTVIFGVAREIYMLGVLAAAYLNYYFMQVMLEIDSLPTLVVFYPVIQRIGG